MATDCPRKPPVFALAAVFLFTLFILNTSVTSELNDSEKKALLTFKYNVRHSLMLRWNESEPACSWRGVMCDPSETTVVYLRLPAMGLTGEIPTNTIGMLPKLRGLSLRYNGLYGEIPSDFSNLNYLTFLLLDNNLFSGKLPDLTGEYLTNFNVSFNKLNSSVPSSLSKFPKSAFFGNDFLCDYPYPPCKGDYSTQFAKRLDNTPEDNREVVGVSFGSALLLMILLCSAGKNMYRKLKPPPSKALEMDRSSKGVLFEDEFDLEDFLKTSVEVLGEGSVGTSYKQVLPGKKKKKKTVVVKRLKHVAVTEEEFKSRMEVLGKMKSKNVVPLRGFFNCSETEKLLVYDYMPAGSLSAHLHGSIRTQLDWDHGLRIALSAAKGLAYLHMDGEVVHGNIKSTNIFLQQESNNEASLSDYGLNILFHGSRSVNHHAIGYLAPEALKTGKFTLESDVYSFGVLLFELLTGKNPNQASSDKEGVHFSKFVGSHVCEPKVELFDMEITTNQYNNDKMVQLLRIAKECVSIVPNKRPQMRNVVNMIEDML